MNTESKEVKAAWIGAVALVVAAIIGFVATYISRSDDSKTVVADPPVATTSQSVPPPTSSTAGSASTTVTPGPSTATTTVPAATTLALDDPGAWKVPEAMLGTWSGRLTYADGGNFALTLFIKSPGEGRGSIVGQSKGESVAKDVCWNNLSLTTLQPDGSVEFGLTRTSGSCPTFLTGGYALALRSDGRLDAKNGYGYSGFLTKVR